MHVVIVGAKAALAQSIMEEFYEQGHAVTAVGRHEIPSDTKRIDVLITCTGKVRDGKIGGSLGLSQWNEVIEDNLTSVFKAMEHFSPYFSSPANVVILGSVTGSTGAYGAANYAAAKAGLVGLVRSAALEWASRDIRVNLLELGYINAGMGARLDSRVKSRVLETIPL